MKKSVKSIGTVMLLVLAVALLATVAVFRPRITVQRETSLVGPEDNAISLLRNGAQLTEIQKSVENSGKNVDEISWMVGSLLYWAADDERIDVAEWLLNEGTNPNGIRPSMTPLRPAILNEDIAMVKLLVKFGADPDLDPGSGVTPRVLAESDGNAEIIAALPPPAKATKAQKDR